MKTVTVVDFSEIFGFAEEKIGWSWNKCNEQFFSTLIHYEGSSEIYLEELQAEIEFQKDGKLERRKVYQCLIDFMVENNITEMLVK